jgi:intein/homing endonuclease
MYEFTLENDEILKVTEDHVIFVYRNNIVQEIKARDIIETDEFITL